ncbi:hypothetical protein BJX61DRAFT_199524 [Aspergillus egyptiacus]|nr:hypothetical protein BJX61DRAFT_199524 [Aspergillus egyptiacus]
MVGKRKRDTAVVSRPKKEESSDDESPAVSELSAQERLRKFFESQFEPLQVQKTATTQRESDDDSDDDSSVHSESESAWSGIDGESEDNAPVEVVEYSTPSVKANDLVDKRARKAFMTAKPPSFSTDLKPSTDRSKKKSEDEDDNDEALNLKNDLALQRLLKESHLLESASDLAPTGKNRHKALDLRMQELGAKDSLYRQKKMPSAMRKGIKAKASSKEEKRRREARENGIILEKPAPKKHVNNQRRERGVGGPSIGKFSGGTLNLSQRDIARVQKSRGGRGGKRRGRR